MVPGQFSKLLSFEYHIDSQHPELLHVGETTARIPAQPLEGILLRDKGCHYVINFRINSVFSAWVYQRGAVGNPWPWLLVGYYQGERLTMRARGRERFILCTEEWLNPCFKARP